MIIDTVDHNNMPIVLVCEHIASVHLEKSDGLWPDGLWRVVMLTGCYIVTEAVAQGIIKVLKSMHNIREVKP